MSSRQEVRKYMCRILGHRFDQFHMWEVVCSRCHICRNYTVEDEQNLAKKKERLRREGK